MKVPRHLCVVLMTQQGALHSRGCDLNTTALQLFKNILRYNKKWHPVELLLGIAQKEFIFARC